MIQLKYYKDLNHLLTRSSIRRAMVRLNVNKLDEIEHKNIYQTFEEVSEIGHIHIDVKHLTRLNNIKSYVYVAIDRKSRFVY